MTNLDKTSAIASVTYFAANPVHTCDRCGQGIKHVFVVKLRDGSRNEYGIECINRILSGETNLRKLFNKNVKLLQKRQLALRALSLPAEQMPRGSEYFGSGQYFVADENGDDILADNHWFFHPVYDEAKNTAGGRYIVSDPAARLARINTDIEDGRIWLTIDIARIEQFLAKVLRSHKGPVQNSATQPATPSL